MLGDVMISIRQLHDKHGEVQFDIVLYNKTCIDARCGAWVYKHKMKKLGIDDDKVLFVPMVDGKYPVDLNIDKKRVLVINGRFNNEDIVHISAVCECLYIFGRYKSTKWEMTDFKNVYSIFDMKRSRTQIVWDYFFGQFKSPTPLFSDGSLSGQLFIGDMFITLDKIHRRPWFIDVLTDYILQKWDHPSSNGLCEYLFFHEIYSDTTKLDSLLKSSEKEINTMKDKGLIILEVKDKEVSDAVNDSVLMDFKTPSGKNYKVHFFNCKISLISDVGNKLALKDNCDFAAKTIHYLKEDVWSIYCIGKDKVNLSELCKEFGGECHTNTIRFTVKNEKGVLQRMFVNHK